MSTPEVVSFFGVFVTLAIFVLGVVYHSGKLAQRVDNLEHFAEKYEKHFDALFDAVRRIEDLLEQGGRR